MPFGWSTARLLPLARQYALARFPIRLWLPKYNRHNILGDVVAGLTVGMMVVPQGLAFAKIADLPLQYGLYCSIFGPLVYTIFGTAKDTTIGPTSVMSLVVATALAVNNVTSPELAIALAFMAGMVQLVLGLLGLGFIVDFFSFPVVSGFTSAVAITIGTQQVPKLLGINARRDFYFCVYDICKNLPNTRPFDALIGLLCIALLIFLRWVGKRYSKRPEWYSKVLWFCATARNSIVIVITIIIGYALSKFYTCPTTKAGVCPLTLVGAIPAGLPSPRLPELNSDVLQSLGSSIVTVALIGFLESIAISKSFAKINKYVVDASQELVAIGMCNIIGSFFSAYPATGSFSRSAVNSESGVKTPLTGLVSGLVVIISVVALTPCFEFIPQAALAAIIIAAVATMVDYQSVPVIWRASWKDFTCLFVAFFAVLFAGVEYGMLGAIGVSVLFLLYTQARPTVTLVGEKKFDGISQFVGINEYGDATQMADMLIFRLDGPLVFPSSSYFIDTIAEVEQKQFNPEAMSLAIFDERKSLRVLILDFSSVASADLSGVKALEEVIEEYQSRRVCILIAGCKQHVFELLTRCGVVSTFGLSHFHPTVHLAVNVSTGENFDDYHRNNSIVQGGFEDSVTELDQNEKSYLLSGKA